MNYNYSYIYLYIYSFIYLFMYVCIYLFIYFNSIDDDCNFDDNGIHNSDNRG